MVVVWVGNVYTGKKACLWESGWTLECLRCVFDTHATHTVAFDERAIMIHAVWI
jgi:hypothetical protein